MKFPFSWLNDFIELNKILDKEDGIIHRVSEKLTKAGIEVEDIKIKKFYDGNVVIGRIEELSPHPTKQQYFICEVDVNDDEHKIIITSDTTVKKGDKVVYCYPGTTVGEDNMLVDVKSIEGINSNGMLLAMDELGIEKESQTLWKLTSNWEIGSDLLSNILPPFMKEEYVFAIKVPSNRADVLSILGVARELSSIYNIPLKPLQHFKFNEELPKPHIEIHDSRCHRYCSRILKNVKVRESDDLIKYRLLLSGQRPINNVVDVTNYVMIAIGQPMHAFDYDKLAGGKIIVRPSKEGETMLALNGENINLPNGTMVIADEEKPVAIAGVIGGEETGISETTTSILLESAYFDYNSIRKTVKEIGISTESSNRFSRDIGFYTTELAINLATSLLGDVKVSQFTDVRIQDSKALRDTYIKTSFSAIRSNIGGDIPDDTIKQILTSLGFEIQQKADKITVKVPPYRKDVSIEEDIFEEVSRIYGYDNIPSTLPRIDKNPEIPSNELRYESLIRHNLSSQGLTEVMNFSFISERDVETFKLESPSLITISNPMVAEDTILRPILLINILKTVRRNINNGVKNLSLFEVGRVFANSSDGFIEEKNICIVLHGNKYENWFSTNGYSYHDLKEIIDKLFLFLGLRTEVRQKRIPFLHDYISGEIVVEGESVGYIGKVHPEITQKLEIQDTLVGEISLTRLEKYLGKEVVFKGVNRLPSSTKSISVLVPKDYHTSNLISFIQNYETNNQNLEITDVRVMDIYEGSKLPEGMKSVNILFKLQWVNEVREEAEIKVVFTNIIKDIQEKLGFSIRGVQ